MKYKKIKYWGSIKMVIENCKCPQCGKNAKLVVEEQWQEYPGAVPNNSYTYITCVHCGYTKYEKKDINWDMCQENYRGW